MISLDFQPCGNLSLLKTLFPWFWKCPYFPGFSCTIMQPLSPLWGLLSSPISLSPCITMVCPLPTPLTFISLGTT